MPTSSYAQEIWPDGSKLDDLQTLLPVAGGVSISSAAEVPISAIVASKFGYLQRLEAICTAVGSTIGDWTLRDKVTGSTLLVLKQPIAIAVLGTRYTWDFPKALKMAAIGDQFTIQGSVNTLGTWFWILNGYMLKV